MANPPRKAYTYEILDKGRVLYKRKGQSDKFFDLDLGLTYPYRLCRRLKDNKLVYRLTSNLGCSAYEIFTPSEIKKHFEIKTTGEANSRRFL